MVLKIYLPPSVDRRVYSSKSSLLVTLLAMQSDSLPTFLSTSLERHTWIADSAFVSISSHLVAIIPLSILSTPSMAFCTPFWIKMALVLTCYKPKFTLLSNNFMPSFIVNMFPQQKTSYNTVKTTWLWYQLKCKLRSIRFEIKKF